MSFYGKEHVNGEGNQNDQNQCCGDQQGNTRKGRTFSMKK
jgi:hypothetical protein